LGVEDAEKEGVLVKSGSCVGFIPVLVIEAATVVIGSGVDKGTNGVLWLHPTRKMIITKI
jgi:hypothetical protein